MSARSRSRPWYRDPFDLGEAGAACLRGHVFALRCVPSWVGFGVELLPAVRIWLVPGHGAAELWPPPDLDYGFPFAALLARSMCFRCGAIKPSVAMRNPAVESDDGQSVEHALPDAVPLCDQCAWVLQYDMLQGKPRGWRFRGGYHVVVL